MVITPQCIEISNHHLYILKIQFYLSITLNKAGKKNLKNKVKQNKITVNLFLKHQYILFTKLVKIKVK